MSLEFCISHGQKYLLLCAHLCCILEKLLQYTHRWNWAFQISHICYWPCRLSHPTFIDILCIAHTIFDHLFCTCLRFSTVIMSHLWLLASHLQKTLNFSDFGESFPPSPLIRVVKMSHLRVRGCQNYSLWISQDSPHALFTAACTHLHCAHTHQ